MPETPTRRWWDPVHLVALFGRYTRDQKGDSPHDGILVGREGQRAFIMDVLNPRSGPGAYLITGHRGAGKTSFINACLREYEDDVFTRFLNGKVGRALLWDRIGLALLGLCASAALVVLFEVIALLTVQAPKVQSWLIISPLLLLGAAPIIYGWGSIAAASRTFLLLQEEEQSDGDVIPIEALRRVMMHAAGAVVVLFCLFVVPLASHAYGLSLLFLSGSCAIAASRLLYPATVPASHGTGRAILSLPALARRLALFFGTGALVGALWHWHMRPQDRDAPEAIVAGLILGTMAFALGTGAQAVLERRARPGAPLVLPMVASRLHMRRLLTTFIVLGASIGAGWLWLKLGGSSESSPNPHRQQISSHIVPLVVLFLVVCGILHHVARERGKQHALDEREPLPDWSLSTAALLLKGICAVAVGLQILHVPLLQLFGSSLFAPIVLPSAPGSLFGYASVTGVLSFGPFTQPLWVITIFATLALVYNTEYEWILIPFQRIRQDSAARPHDLPAGPKGAAMRREATRQASQTLPWQILHAWLPVMVVSVNLGSERLPYAEIVRAMLSAIRDRYASRFVSVRSGFPLAIWTIVLIALFELTTVAGDHLFWPRRAPESRPADDKSGVLDLRTLLLEIDKGRICTKASDYEPEDYIDLPPAIRLGCSGAGTDGSDHAEESETLRFLYFDMLQSPLGRRSGGSSFDEEEMLLCGLFPCNRGADLDDSATGGRRAPSTEPTGPTTVRSGPRPVAAAVETFVTGMHSLVIRGREWLVRATPRGEQRHVLHFRGYHLVLLAATLVIVRVLSWLLPNLPYRRNLSAIDDALDRLTSRRVMAPPNTFSAVVSTFNGILGRTQLQSKEIDPENARTVETSFIAIIEALQRNAVPVLGATGRSVSLPAPEVIFLFDELDKVGVRFEQAPAPDGGAVKKPAANSASLDAERLRSLALHRLLSDMKSLLSSTSARFLFVGGRNLHDEWIADRTARLPLLSSIFKAEVYLPSLLADLPRASHDQWLRRIHQYAQAQYNRSKQEHFRSKHALVEPRTLEQRGLDRATRFAPPPETLDHDWLLLYEDRGGRRLQGSFVMDLGRHAPQRVASHSRQTAAHDEVHDQFLHFLAYRSIGNPKRLRDILEAMLRPTARLVDATSTHSMSSHGESLSVHGLVQHSEHSLHLSEPMRYRLQMISETYGVLASSFAARYARRDDKLAVSLFNLADFLFRFHGRGFNWSNLERVDELVHVHRAHDHRRILEELVHQWSNRFLLQVLNGMYDFRFRAHIAREIDYISRQSEEEMAAFNFTLDESEPLKALYKATMARMEQPTADALAALGELHEFDQEFELARSYYQQSIARMDEIYAGSMQPALDGEARALGNPIWLALSSHPRGLEGLRRHMTWGIHRLRLVLQIGMTFEIAKNYERAAVEYRNARTLARALLRAMVDEEGRRREDRRAVEDESPSTWEALEEHLHGRREPPPRSGNRRHLLKHMSIVFQPAFAEAWLAEKMVMGVDSSISLVEDELRQIRMMLPFVRKPFRRRSAKDEGDKATELANLAKLRDGSLALVMAELHDKAGDLYFFKGRQVIEHSTSKRGSKGSWIDDENYGDKDGPNRGKTEGYQLRAHEHYVMAIHEIQRFVDHRRASSRAWNLEGSPHATNPTIEYGGWPDYVLRILGNTLCDLAEGTLGRISFFGALSNIQKLEREDPSPEKTPVSNDDPEMSQIRHDIEDGVKRFDRAFRAWMEPSQDASTKFVVGSDYNLGDVDDWLGELPEPEVVLGLDPHHRLRFKAAHTDTQRLLFAFYSNWAAAEMLRQAGYVEDAAHELMQIADAAAQLLWWATSARAIAHVHGDDNRKHHQLTESGPWVKYLTAQWNKSSSQEKDHWDPFWNHIIEIGLCSLRKAMVWFKRSRAENRAKTPVEKRAEVRANTPPGHREPFQPTDDLPRHLIVIGCSLGLAGVASRWQDGSTRKGERGNARRRMLCKLMHEMAGDLWEALGPEPESATEMKQKLTLLLKELYLRYPYPMLTRLHALKVFIDSEVLSDQRIGLDKGTGAREFPEYEDRKKTDEIIAAALHLRHLAHQYNADTLFTPFHVGFTLANAYLLTYSPENRTNDTLRDEARRALNNSEESVTMRRAYYESLEQLYYLYDGFNDRDIHFNHALQMASLEVCLFLKHALDHKKPSKTDD